MARLTRLSVPGQPHHLLQRGNSRNPIVVDDADRERFIFSLRSAALAQGVAIHAYALLDDHFHLLATPQEGAALGRMMQTLGRNYVTSFNQRHGRSGTLWEGRFRCGVLEAEAWLLPCMRYIELSPLRAGVVGSAQDYAWSSARHHLGLRNDPLLNDHAVFWSIGNTPFEREAAYREFLLQTAPPDHDQMIVNACLKGWALGSAAFVTGLEREQARPASPRARGRPRKHVSVPI